MPFLEDRLPIGVRIGMQSQEMFSVDVSVDAANNRYTKLISPVPQYAFSFDYIKKNTDLAASVVSLYRRVYGSYAAFRVYAHDDHTTAQDGVSEPTALDCTLKQISTTVFQLQKEYGLGQPALPTIGRPKRLLHKPIANTAKIAVSSVPSIGTSKRNPPNFGAMTMSPTSAQAPSFQVSPVSRFLKAILPTETRRDT